MASLQKEKKGASSRETKFRLDETREQEILDVAAQVFLTDGFSAASTNEIARRANASKGTFYARFKNKEELFLAVIERRSNAITESLVANLPQEPDTAITLHTFGTHLLKEVLSEQQVALLRIIGMEAHRFPSIGQRFYELGPMRGQANLAKYFQGQIDLGRLVAANPARMGEHLMSLLMGGAVRWYMTGLIQEKPTPQKLKAHLEDAVSAFMRAYGEAGRKR